MFNKIYNLDCLEGMKEIPDGAVDFILTDLPFGITSNYWDKKIPFEPMWEQFNRVTKKNAAVALFANGKFVFELGNSNLKNYHYKWCVEKDCASGFLNANKMPLKCHQDILIFYRQLPTYNPQYFYHKPYSRKFSATSSKNYRDYLEGHETISEDGRRYPRDVLQFEFPKAGFYKDVEKVDHPTQKPVDLLEYLIKTYTNEGEVVLDATIGSGSTAVAAINTNRKFIGYELDEKYFEIAQKRINEALAKKSQGLF